MSLRKELIKLAHEKPELREHLLPLVTDKTANQKNVYAELIIEVVPPYLRAEKILAQSGKTLIFFKNANGLEKILAMIENGYLDFMAQKVGLDFETSMKKSFSMGKMDLFKETKSSIGTKIEQYLSQVSK